MSKKRAINLYLKEEVIHKLKRLSEELNTGVSELVNRMVEQYKGREI